MKIFVLTILVAIISVFHNSCSGDRLKSTEGMDSLQFYRMAFEYIKGSKELLKYGNKYGLSNLKQHLCVSSGIRKPDRLLFIQDYIDYIFQKDSDSVKRIKRDSILLLPTEDVYGRQITEDIKIGNLASIDSCRLQVFFMTFNENYLEASVRVVEKYEADFFSFDDVVNTSLSYFFIFENERIVKVFVEEVTS